MKGGRKWSEREERGEKRTREGRVFFTRERKKEIALGWVESFSSTTTKKKARAAKKKRESLYSQFCTRLASHCLP